MPRKKADEPAATSSTNGTPEVGTGHGAKTRAVEEAMAMGIESPTKIAEHINSTYGLGITVSHVSAVKTAIAKRKGKKGRRKKRAAAPTATVVVVKPSKLDGGLSPTDLTELATLADRAGGVDSLQQFLTALKSFR